MDAPLDRATSPATFEDAERLKVNWFVPASLGGYRRAALSLELEIRDVGVRGHDWDGFGSAAPDSEAVTRAMTVADALVSQANSTGFAWISPLVGSNEGGDISLEWWKGDRKLTLYIGRDATEFVLSWGEDIESEMEAGELERGKFQALWKNLHGAAS